MENRNQPYSLRYLVLCATLQSTAIFISLTTSMPMAMSSRRVAVIGSGVTGCALACQLVVEDETVHVSLFDWGRAVGGRASHRFRPEPSTSAPDKTVTLHFDHGAQFFHATNPAFLDMVRPVAKQWPDDVARLGWLDRQTGRYTKSANSPADSSAKGFFGACDSDLDSDRFVGIGGMDAICKEMLRNATARAPDRISVHEMTRVARCEKEVSATGGIGKVWKLYGDGLGHEQANAQALKQSTENILGVFDEIVLTDHMAAAMPSWHPCHVKGLSDAVPELVTSLRGALDWDESDRRFRTVKPLFSCMVALNQKLSLEFDAASIGGSDILQWACCQDSRPHDVTEQQADNIVERWLLVSTPKFAAKCLGAEGMSKKPLQLTSQSPSSKSEAEVEYIPQTDDYLRADLADQMWDEFVTIVQKTRQHDDVIAPAAFLKCQRWGAAFTESKVGAYQNIQSVLKSHEIDESVTVCGDFIHSHLTPSDKKKEIDSASNSFVIQNAAMSGISAAKRIAERLKETKCT